MLDSGHTRSSQFPSSSNYFNCCVRVTSQSPTPSYLPTKHFSLLHNHLTEHLALLWCYNESIEFLQSPSEGARLTSTFLVGHEHHTKSDRDHFFNQLLSEVILELQQTSTRRW